MKQRGSPTRFVGLSAWYAPDFTRAFVNADLPRAGQCVIVEDKLSNWP